MKDLFFIDISCQSSILNTHDNSVAIFFITGRNDFDGHYELLDLLHGMTESNSDLKYTFECCDAIDSIHYSYIPISILKKYSYRNIESHEQPVVILVSVNDATSFTKFFSFLTKLKLMS